MNSTKLVGQAKDQAEADARYIKQMAQRYGTGSREYQQIINKRERNERRTQW